MTRPTKEVLKRVPTWPEEDQQELADLARVIESRRTGVYVLSDDERAAIADARQSRVVPEEKITQFWKRHGVA